MDGIGLYHTFLQIHRPQLQSSGVPEVFWEILFKKLKGQVFDSGMIFQLARIDYEEIERPPTEPVWKLFVSSESTVSANNPENIYLIDHAWTYSTDSARQNLLQVPGLLDRMCTLMGLDADESVNNEEKTEYVLREMWRYNQTYALRDAASVEDRMPVWYIMDEVGSAINHSDQPNFRTVPFLHVPEGVTYTLLYPLRDVEPDEEVTRDFVEGQTNDSITKRALLLPWRKDDSFVDEDFTHIEPGDDYFLEGHVRETLAEVNTAPQLNPGERIRVYSQYNLVKEFLTNPLFEIVDSEQDANVLWLTSHFKEYNELSTDAPNVFVNQFPFENVITIKDLLCVVCRRQADAKKCDFDTLETYPIWLPTTYNLRTELVKFVSYFERRQAKGLDNHWICKPWNLARGLDTHITNNLYQILRLPSTGPKIAQKYISDPVLYSRPEIGRVKFDVRYVVLLKYVQPLTVYVYSNFFLRFANKEFALNNFDQYEQHFTVMNYVNDNTSLHHVKCADFIHEWKKQYPKFSWRNDVEKKILSMLKKVFQAAVAEKPPRGIAHNLQSRALYAADIMLEWRDKEINPVLLEVNFTPDCKRACDYYPNFYNDIFKLLFLDVENPTVFHKL
ncbi:tubulin--tyrosine ligase-like protein 12 [Neodiprion virginianus]|uniref:tubulin--tyrosine ligase-like protein 12 n=1 Tax=Neodiprion virginianus TaxID=2961670 RepID=UPI001EE6BE63|nr:tubulin--tyrosine ligase-like protein 12 [Neodiprion virginianus]